MKFLLIKMALLLNIISIILVIIIIIAIIYVISYLKKIKQKNDIIKNTLDNFSERFNRLNKKSPEEEDLDELDKIARDFFKEKDNIDYKKSYFELAKEYKTSGESNKSDFCNKMSKIMYSEQSPERAEIAEVIEMFEKILNENHS